MEDCWINDWFCFEKCVIVFYNAPHPLALQNENSVEKCATLLLLCIAVALLSKVLVLDSRVLMMHS